jgi:glutamate N-acetyltransferase / amino-acid N-acetyltransferase
MKNYHMATGGITAPKGFLASGVFCGIRKSKKDIAIIRSEVPADVAAVFTTSITQAAPVVLDKAILLRSSKCSAITVNSGNANACTGEQGMKDAEEMIELTAKALNIPHDEILISSTGVIGQYLPMAAIREGIAMAAQALSHDGSTDAAEAIMTTDTYAKELALSLDIDGVTVTIGGIAKGSGMIQPNMATMLGFLTTDANIDQAFLQKTFRAGVELSFNRISVDGDTSTNDMAVILANGQAGNVLITEGSPAAAIFTEALNDVMLALAKMIARDGEGATKLVEIVVTGAENDGEAVIAARSVANSNLVKTAIHGEDANWGRILAALGYSGIDFHPHDVELAFNDLPILGKQFAILIDEEKVKQSLAGDSLTVQIDLNKGAGNATFWTCDLSKQYVHINASYRS